MAYGPRRLQFALRSARSLLASQPTRSLSYPVHRHATIGAVLSSASAANPLKDAVKFLGSNQQKPTIWTYRELATHVDALAAGLHEMSYSQGDAILALLSPDDPEYAVLVLAASKLGLSIVACPTPTDSSAVDITVVRDMLRKHRPRAFIIGKNYMPSHQASDDDGIIASVSPLLSAIAPSVARDDAKGIDGFVPLTGRPFVSQEYPYLKHVIHTGETNMRGTISFKSLLVYSGFSPASDARDATLLTAPDGSSATHAAILKQAEDIGSRLSLGPDHSVEAGKLVVGPSLSHESVAAMVSAVMHEALLVSSGAKDPALVSKAEHARSL